MRHFTRVRRPFHVRLACVRHAASVQSEPESNSPVEKYLIQRTEVLKSNSKLYFPTRSSLVKEPCRSSAAVLRYATFRFACQQLFSKFFSGGAFGVALSSEPLCLSAFSGYAHFPPSCQTLFSTFSEVFSKHHANYVIILSFQHEFFFFPSAPKSAFPRYSPASEARTDTPQGKTGTAHAVPGQASAEKKRPCALPRGLSNNLSQGRIPG